MKKNSTAIVTLIVGEKYQNNFTNYCQSNWSAYCNKYNYDLLVIKELFDKSERAMKRSPSWQKLLILSQEFSKKYSKIVWIDSDIIINPLTSPAIDKNTPLEKICGVEYTSFPSRNMYTISLKRRYSFWDKTNIPYINNITPYLYYKNRRINADKSIDSLFQAGVFIASPQYHNEIFEYIYNNYEDTHGPEWNYEMPAMSYEIIKNNLQYWIEPEFNLCVSNIMHMFYELSYDTKFSIPNTHENIFMNELNQFLEKKYKNKFIKKFCRFLTKKYKNLTGEFNQSLTKEYEKAFTQFLIKEYLYNIYSLSYFMHFAGCINLLEKYNDFIHNL